MAAGFSRFRGTKAAYEWCSWGFRQHRDWSGPRSQSIWFHRYERAINFNWGSHHNVNWNANWSRRVSVQIYLKSQSHMLSFSLCTQSPCICSVLLFALYVFISILHDVYHSGRSCLNFKSCLIFLRRAKKFGGFPAQPTEEYHGRARRCERLWPRPHRRFRSVMLDSRIESSATWCNDINNVSHCPCLFLDNMMVVSANARTL